MHSITSHRQSFNWTRTLSLCVHRTVLSFYLHRSIHRSNWSLDSFTLKPMMAAWQRSNSHCIRTEERHRDIKLHKRQMSHFYHMTSEVYNRCDAISMEIHIFIRQTTFFSLEFWTIFAICYWDKFYFLLFTFYISIAIWSAIKKGDFRQWTIFISKNGKNYFLFLVSNQINGISDHNFCSGIYLCVYALIAKIFFSPWTRILRTKTFSIQSSI